MWLIPTSPCPRSHAGTEMWHLGQSVQSPFSQEIKKTYNLGGIHGWAKAVACAQVPATFSARGSNVLVGASRPLQVRGLRG